ncbi:DNA-processing protein DprA [Actinocorallia longicatena]|uniref:DNA-processing protein DprA n=1 Tax=Actinocorallia longicatena TaxID=111803 RepID=A0ABP6PZ02_9ACTN
MGGGEGERERWARAWLSAVGEPGDGFMYRLVAQEGAVGAVEAVRRGCVPDGLGISERRLDGWRMRVAAADPDAAMFICEQVGGRLLCPGDLEWPSTLGHLREAAPIALWVRGGPDLRQICLRSVSVVGARLASPYGERVAQELGAEMAEQGWTVVSGAALGIDAAAHRGCLAAEGLTVAVLANGIDLAYPPRNSGLLAEIAARGLIVSEWPPGTHPTRPRFLVRNRVIAALTTGTVVVEADLRSGALNTANHARSLGRHLMAYPGNVTSLMSRGCHDLLRSTPPARLVTNSTEVIEEVGRIGEGLTRPDRPTYPRDTLDPDSRQVLEAVPATGGGATPMEIATAASVDLITARSRLSLLHAMNFIERTRTGWRLRKAPPGHPQP